MSKPETDVIRRVFNDDGTGCYLEIGPYAAAPEFIELRTGEGESSIRAYLKITARAIIIKHSSYHISFRF